eukprot:6309602-Prymnesium_polylepis.1
MAGLLSAEPRITEQCSAKVSSAEFSASVAKHSVPAPLSPAMQTSVRRLPIEGGTLKRSTLPAS